jgi:hypothetical protein
MLRGKQDDQQGVRKRQEGPPSHDRHVLAQGHLVPTLTSRSAQYQLLVLYYGGPRN